MKHPIRIIEVRERTHALTEELTNLWERSVRATHLFLTEDEIRRIRMEVPRAIKEAARLVIAETADDRPAALMGIEDGVLEMLFLEPEARGQGLGKRMLQYGIDRCAVRELTVNEQNPQALGFYRHMGFQVCKRTDHDSQGAPYPLLYMRLP